MGSKRAGALLFGIILLLVLSLLTAALVILTTNQYRMINSEVYRTRAFYRCQAGMELAIYHLYSNTNTWTPGTANYNQYHPENIGGTGNVNINITTGDLSTYTIRVNTNYES